jgi:hypothetical protein
MVRVRDSRRWVGSSWSGRGRSSGRSSDQRGRRRCVRGRAGLVVSCREMASPSSTAVRVMTPAFLVDRRAVRDSGTASHAVPRRQDHHGSHGDRLRCRPHVVVDPHRISSPDSKSCRGTSFLTPPGYHVRALERTSGTGQSMIEQVPEDLTEVEEADRLDVDRSEDEGDTASEVDRWEDEGGHDRAG